MTNLAERIKYISDITVRPIQSMGGDSMVVAAAKVSTSGEEALSFKDKDANYGLINYLMKHRHGSAFEHSSMTFFVHAPIFVWREWHRHRIGFCLAGDTEIWTESIAIGSGRTIRKRQIRDLYKCWNHGVSDNMGRTRFLPSVRSQKLRVLNEETGLFELGRIKNITESGVKECLLVETLHKKGYELRCSKDHRILTSEGWIKAGDLEGGEMIAVNGVRSTFEQRQIPPALRAGIGVWTSMQRSSLIKEHDKCYVCNDKFYRDELVLDHVIPVVADLKLALDSDNLKPICRQCHQIKSNSEQILARRLNTSGVKFSRLYRKPTVISIEMTYDIEMIGPHHNFVANGIVVHNSYNEESARYKQLEPTFWIPRRDRKMIPIEGWKPGKPKFLTMDEAVENRPHDGRKETTESLIIRLQDEADAWYEREIARDKAVYELAYLKYQESIDDGIAMEVARCKLPVAIYSSCWVTTNPRALMALISLRTHEPDAKFVSYPQAEIEEAVRVTEEIFNLGWPLTYRSFVENGRVGP